MYTPMALLPILLLLPFSTAIAPPPSYTIPRTTEQQVVATVPPAAAAADQASLPFLRSPSGTYAAYLRRSVDTFGDSAGRDACYVQVQQAARGGGMTVWESECTPVGGADTCDLAFSPVGLELFAGGHSVWDTGVDGDPGDLSLDDGGDMQIADKAGVTLWKASGEPWTGQGCGLAAPPAVSPEGDQLAPPSPASAIPESPPDVSPMPPSEIPPLSPEQPQYSPPPAAPTASGQFPQTMPPAVGPPTSPDEPLEPPPVADETMQPSPPRPSSGTSLGTPFLPVLAPPLPSSPTGVPPGLPRQPLGATSPMPAATAFAPSARGAGLPFGHGQQEGEGVFGQQQQQQDQLFNGGNQPLVESSGGWPRTKHCTMAFILLMALGFEF